MTINQPTARELAQNIAAAIAAREEQGIKTYGINMNPKDAAILRAAE